MVDPICPREMVLQKPESAVHPDEPVFCIGITEVPQEPWNRYLVSQAKAGYEMLIKLVNGGMEKKTSQQRSDLEKEAARQFSVADKVSAIEIKPVGDEEREVPTGNLAGPKKPAVFVKWQEARDYCRATYPGGDLPTERQWENACGGGTYCTPSKNELKHTEARFASLGKGPVDVDSYRANARRTKNQTGNVWEWMRDDAGNGLKRIRGGSWIYNSDGDWNLRADSRNTFDPGNGDADVGFRCVASPRRLQKAK